MDIPDFEYSSDEEKIPVRDANEKVFQTHLTGWNELFLKDQVKRGIRQCGFQHPSTIQTQAIPYALQGSDLICQAKSGMGKTAVFVISVLNQMQVEMNGEYQTFSCLVICHTRELSHQIHKDFKRLGRYFRTPELRFGCFFGGFSLEENAKELSKKSKPHIVIGTPGRLVDLFRKKLISLNKLKYFIVDECDKVFQSSQMRSDVQQIFTKSPLEMQVMMFSATFPSQMKVVIKKYLKNEVNIFIDEGKLILHGLKQFYIVISEEKKFQKLVHLLDTLAFNQAIIFVNRVERAKKLNELLHQKLFNPICLHSNLSQEERLLNFDLFKTNYSRLLVATDLLGRGIDIERVNLVINYDFPYERNTYLHRVGRAGRFGTKGVTINFVKPYKEPREKVGDKEVFEEVQDGFKIKIETLPKELDVEEYM